MSASSSKTVLIGNFDGLHLGHQKLIRFAQKISKESNTQLTLVTFRPHPRKVLYPDQNLKFINTFEEKVQLFSEYEIDHLIVHGSSWKNL